jgi:hypothetical protein
LLRVFCFGGIDNQKLDAKYVCSYMELMFLNRSLLSNAKLKFELICDNAIMIYFLGFWLLIYLTLSILVQNSEHRLMDLSDC